LAFGPLIGLWANIRDECLAVQFCRKDGCVDFIERYFGFSPDGGDGSLEIAIILLIVLAYVTAGMRSAK